MSKFQIILIAIFGLFIVGGVAVFSVYKGNSVKTSDILIWGTISQSAFNNFIQNTELNQNDLYRITYVEKTKENFDASFIEALASDNGPDIFILPSEKILKHQNKIFPVPYTSFTERQFKDSFIEGSEVYMAPSGILAFPISVNPMVMYWNRPLLTEAKITEPPKYWDEFYNLANLISKKDGALNIQKSAVAFGEFANISHAKEIILNLAMQAGTPVTMWSEGKVQSVFSNNFNKPLTPAEAAINFYTEFGNPAKPSYSWNRSLPSSTNYFLSGDLALYFGFADEIGSLQLRNPNLNFDVAPVPISRQDGTPVSFAYFNGLAITKSSKNKSAAFGVISILTSKAAASEFSKRFKLPPVRRDLLAVKQTSAFDTVFYDSAIRSKTWIDPNPEETNDIFKRMIESITSGRSRVWEAVSKANAEISSLLPK